MARLKDGLGGGGKIEVKVGGVSLDKGLTEGLCV